MNLVLAEFDRFGLGLSQEKGNLVKFGELCYGAIVRDARVRSERGGCDVAKPGTN